MAKTNPVKQAIEKFFKTTTLHGFKYLMSQYYFDRISWVLGCVASACCAGVLCVVLWDRFQDMPDLLQLQAASEDIVPQPTVGFCQPSETVAETIVQFLKTRDANKTMLSGTLAHALQGKNTDKAQVELLEELVRLNKVSLLDMLLKHSPDCSESIRKCRWRNIQVDCRKIFKKEITGSGVCCVATPFRISTLFIPIMQRFDTIKTFDLGLQCVQGSTGLLFFTYYFGEDFIDPTLVSPGFNYYAHLTFNAEKDYDADKIVDDFCVNTKEYSKSQCLRKCIEKYCGCSDPFNRSHLNRDEHTPPPCPLKRLSCLRKMGQKDNISCSCLPPCQTMLTKLVIERGPYKSTQTSLDPIYSGLSDKNSLILRLRINTYLSKSFVLMPTETWLTLLSSLGGVFNMFLGVGLFSVLEFLFLLLVKIPMAMRRSPK